MHMYVCRRNSSLNLEQRGRDIKRVAKVNEVISKMIGDSLNMLVATSFTKICEDMTITSITANLIIMYIHTIGHSYCS